MGKLDGKAGGSLICRSTNLGGVSSPGRSGTGLCGVCRRSETHQPFLCDYRLIHHDTGEIRYVRDHGVPVMDAAGRMMRIDGIVTDVTEQRLAQQALLEREERYRRLVQVSPDAISINRGDCITSGVFDGLGGRVQPSE